MYHIAKKMVTNEAMQIIAVQIDYADWLKFESLLNEYSNPKEKSTDLNHFVDVIPFAKEQPQFSKDLPLQQRAEPDVFLAEINAIHKQLSHLPPLTDEILEMAKTEGRP